MRAYLHYKRLQSKLTYFRSRQGDEVDFIIGNQVAIEVKTSAQVKDKYLKGLERFEEEQAVQNYILVSFDPIDKKIGHIHCMHWSSFLNKLWRDEFKIN